MELTKKTNLVLADFQPAIVSRQITSFLKKETKKAGFKRLIVAVSGGVDSATAAYLAVKALGRDNVLLLFLPFGNLNPQGLVYAKLVAKSLAVPQKNIWQIDILPLCQPFFKLDPYLDHIRQGNIMARVRMIVLFDLAKKYQALVCGTENKSEYYLGYFTRFGDEASDLEPLRSLYKTQVKVLASHLGVPQPIINQPPTAGLWPGQTDEGQFGFSYETADQILYLFLEKKLSPSSISQKGFSPALIKKVLSWVKQNAFKHHLPKVLF